MSAGVVGQKAEWRVFCYNRVTMVIRYFAYGSNMLTERIQERCAAALPIGVASAQGFALQFSKKSKDDSGKAALISVDSRERKVFGIVFELDDRDLPALDRAEGNGNGYNRDDNFVVVADGTQHQTVVTYLADSAAVVPELKPYDWYLDLVLAGARQHNLPKFYIDELASVSSIVDPKSNRRTRLQALALLSSTGRT